MPGSKGLEGPLEKGSRVLARYLRVNYGGCWSKHCNTTPMPLQITQNSLCKIATIAPASVDISGREN
jgi:hypothetical protein